MKKTLIDKAMDYAKRKHKGQKDDAENAEVKTDAAMQAMQKEI